MAKARTPQAPAIRFKLEPAYASPALVAARLGLTETELHDRRVELYGAGFPIPDITIGNYDLEAVERWCAWFPAALAELGLALVGPHLSEAVRTYRPKADPSGRRPLAKVTSLVYVVGYGPYVKIGFTRLGLEFRLRALQTASPEKLKIYAKIRGDQELERRLHQRFADLRLQGEWFRREGALAEWIKGRCRS